MRLDRDTAWRDSSGDQAEDDDRQTRQGFGFVQLGKSRWDAGLDQAHDGNARYEKGAMILTSNRGFAEWGEVFGDPVVATALLEQRAAPVPRGCGDATA